MADHSGDTHSKLVLGLVVGFLLGAGLLIAAYDVQPPDQGPDPSNPPVSQTLAGGCVPAEAVDTGWAHQVAAGNYRLFTANLTVGHGPDQRANATLVTRHPGEYELRVSTGGDGRPSGGEDCTSGSSVELSANLPVDYDHVAIIVDGTRVTTVERPDATTPKLHAFAWGAGRANTTTQTDTSRPSP